MHFIRLALHSFLPGVTRRIPRPRRLPGVRTTWRYPALPGAKLARRYPARVIGVTRRSYYPALPGAKYRFTTSDAN